MQTTRLIGHKPSLEFLDEYAQMLADKDFIDVYGVYFDYQQAKIRIESDMQHWQEKNFGPFYWRDAKTLEFVGRGGLKTCEVEGEEEIEVAYAIARKFWGKGIAKEIAEAAIADAPRLGMKKLVCFTLLKNSQSLRVMQKCGFIYVRDFLYRHRPHKLHILDLDLAKNN